MTVQQHIDQFSFPIVAVEGDEGRIIAINQEASRVLGVSPDRVFGLLGGEVMGCRYAQGEPGCGQQPRCQLCSVRSRVLDAWECGKPHVGVPAFVETVNGRISLKISTQRWDRLVHVILEILD